MIVLGIDPSITQMGLGVVEGFANKYRLIDYGVLKLSSKEYIPDRLGEIFQCVKSYIINYNIDVVAVEDVFVSNNAKSALKLGQGRGAAIASAIELKKPVYEYTPTQVKKAVSSYGSANKQQVKAMVEIILGVKNIKPLDASDALAVCVCHLNSFKGLSYVCNA
jgi:crossover junction endodeoxyribonuclease RuvC